MFVSIAIRLDDPVQPGLDPANRDGLHGHPPAAQGDVISMTPNDYILVDPSTPGLRHGLAFDPISGRAANGWSCLRSTSQSPPFRAELYFTKTSLIIFQLFTNRLSGLSGKENKFFSPH
jgi:hypothetical protein